jgi:polyisoprenoid-binding protein YceI
MIRNRALLWALLGCAFSSFAHADASKASYVLADGEVRFVCEGEEVTVPAWGQFGTVEGALSLNPLELSEASGNIDVYMVSIRTEDAAWDTMFRRAGFLEIDDHPKSRFVVDKVRGPKRLERGKWVPMTLEGHFVLHGITKKIQVPATAHWMPADPENDKGERIRVRASFHITWDEYQIAMPTGSTRLFAGDGALIHADLTYELSKAKSGRKKRR